MARGDIFEFALKKEDVGCMEASSFEELGSSEFDYVADSDYPRALECLGWLKEMLSGLGARVTDGPDDEGDDGKGSEAFSVVFTEDSIRQYFGGRLESLKKAVEALTETDFTRDTGRLWQVSHIIDNEHGDAVYSGNVFYTFDAFMRHAELGVPYYVGRNVVLMH